MPHIIVKLYAGRSEQQKARPAKEVTRGVMASTGYGGKAVSVAIEDVEPQEWNMHPLRQTLLVTAELSFVQREDGPIEEVRPGDIVRFEPNEKHWHGASADCAMTHIAVAEMQAGSAVTWMEQVSDDQYTGKVR